ncbi:MAG: hypothetical protein JKY31_04255 [Rhodobacteraceae bacterium]|nr:hypothetical protein [Paracoccaceae bacterium]
MTKNTQKPSKEAIEDGLNTSSFARSSGDRATLTVEEKNDGGRRRIELSYDLTNVRNRKAGDKKSISIERIVESISTGLMTDKPKPRRRKSELPDPTKARYHDVNRLDKHFQSRIDEDTDKHIRDFLKATGLSKKEATERAFNLLIELYDYDKS